MPTGRPVSKAIQNPILDTIQRGAAPISEDLKPTSPSMSQNTLKSYEILWPSWESAGRFCLGLSLPHLTDS